MKYYAFSDGGCRASVDIGGWGVVINNPDGTTSELSGFARNTTNNKMELTAAISALESLPQGSDVTLTSDSQYVIKGMNEWVTNWIKRGWKTAAGKPVKNQELWEKLVEVAQKHTVTWKWVKGHNGHDENERCDELANIEMDSNLD